MKVARWVREGTVGKGPQGTSLAVYFIPWESRPAREPGKARYRGKEGREYSYGTARSGREMRPSRQEQRLETGEPCAVKAASTVRRGAV
jgi:hypothetical protein